MKLKTILSLTLIVNGGLCGCSSTQSFSKPAQVKWIRNQEVLCLKNDDASRPWNIKWAISEDTWNDGRLFVTVHARESEKASGSLEFVAAIYMECNGKFRLLKQLKSDSSFFQKPNFVWAEDRTRLLQITEISYGTGVFTQEHIFTLKQEEQDPTLEQAEFIPASESFKKHLGEGEGVWKGVNSRFTDEGLFFNFSIWKEGDGNCCPTAGKVSGTYKLEHKPDGRLHISMDTFKREPVQDAEDK